MTRDEFNREYRLLKQISAKGGRSYTAEHLPTGRAVLVHILDQGQVAGAAGLQSLLAQLPARDKARVLGMMTVDNSLFVVTHFLAGFDGFEAWLQARTSSPSPSAPHPAGPLPPESHGEFTRLFRSAEGIPPGAQDAAPANLNVPSPGPAGGSQYTDLFRSPAEPLARPAESDRIAIPPIRMVGVRVPPPSEPAAPPAGDPPRLTPNLESTAGASSGGEELASWRAPDEPVIRTGDSPPPNVPPPSGDGPSEFTRMLGSVSTPTGELANLSAAPPAGEEPVPTKRSYLPLLLILNLIFILATGLVVYFALRRC